MMLPYSTTSLCGTCYRHLPATVFERDGKVYVEKECKEHGRSTAVVENDVAFYNSLSKTYSPEYWWNVILVEVTDKCNLNCPHCYHQPDNKTTDVPISTLIEQINKLPEECPNIMLAGAEPTVRKDILEVVKAITEQCNKRVLILTNGVKLADEDFVIGMKQAGVVRVSIGLNHPEYQGIIVHKKQLVGITNAIKHKLHIEYIGYTCEHDGQLSYILDEIQTLHKATDQIRIRFGSKIGRVPDEPLRTLSDNYKQLLDVAKSKGYVVQSLDGDDNIYHKMIRVGNAKVRLIQWPDVDNIVLDELMTGPWCQFYDGPVTNFVHQVITRDAFKNKNQPMLDVCPEKYTYALQSELYNVPNPDAHPAI